MAIPMDINELPEGWTKYATPVDEQEARWRFGSDEYEQDGVYDISHPDAPFTMLIIKEGKAYLLEERDWHRVKESCCV